MESRAERGSPIKIHIRIQQRLKYLVDVCYPDAECITVVQDQLNTHDPSALYTTFESQAAKRILDKLEFHYTPVHGSWLTWEKRNIVF